MSAQSSGRRRVVITGLGGLCPLGADWKSVSAALREGRSGVERVPELAEIGGMRTQLAARVRTGAMVATRAPEAPIPHSLRTIATTIRQMRQVVPG